MAPELIFCHAGNKRFAQIAKDAGFLLGARLPDTVYFPIDFADQDWKNPVREDYMKALSVHRPRITTVLDLEHANQLPIVLDWAEEAAQYAQTVVVIPKVFGIIKKIPLRIGHADIRLGYSVPTKFSGTEVPIWEFCSREIHLLGGAPQVQMQLAHYLNVASADGNMAAKLAIRFCLFWVNGTAKGARNRYWPSLAELGLSPDSDAPYKAFELSCKNIIETWQQCGGLQRYEN